MLSQFRFRYGVRPADFALSTAAATRLLRRTASYFLVTVVVLSMGRQDPLNDKLLYPTFFKQDCALFGFPDAKLNDCGYCVNGSTNLPDDYGKDCNNVCDGGAVLDCNDTCGGRAFLDECTLTCTQPGTDDENVRNCMGLCLTGENSVRYADSRQYHKDECGVCVLGAEGVESRFKDCRGNCHLPGNVKLSDYRDVCGSCSDYPSLLNETCVDIKCAKNETEIQCLKCKLHKADICGNCDKKSTKCLKISQIWPTHAPSGTKFEMRITGSFEEQKRNMTCHIAELKDTNATGFKLNITSNFKPKMLRCMIPDHLRLGKYLVTVRENNLNPAEEEILSLDDYVLEIYNKTKIMYTTMTPARYHYRSILNLTNTDKEVILHFKGENVLDLPLTCLILGKNWPKWLGKKTHKAKESHVCVLPLVWSSMTVNIRPSYNGQHELGNQTFSFTFYAAAPAPKIAHISEDGLVISVAFDRTINICGLYKCPCSDLLEESTLEVLGPGVICKWATKAQLLIIPEKPFQDENSVTIAFKSGILKEDDQQVAYPATENLVIEARRVRQEVNLNVSISGPNRIPSCGSFTIFGHHSAPSDGQPTYQWVVSRTDGGTISDPLAEAVLDKNDPYTGLNLDLQSEWFDFQVIYNVVLNVVTTAGISYTKTHHIERMPYLAPIIVAYASTNMNPRPLRPSQSGTLFYELSLPSCVGYGHRALAYWTASDPRVKVDKDNYWSSIYPVYPYALPEDSLITFTANAFMDNGINTRNFTTSSVSIRVGKRHFTAKIRGTGNRIIGSQMHVNASKIVMKGEAYGDIWGLNLRYEWRCFATHKDEPPEKRFPCYSTAPTNETRQFLINETEQTNKDIVFSAKQIDTTIVTKLNFTLEIYNASDPSLIQRDFTTIEIDEEKVYPQVVIEELKVRNVPVHERTPQGHYLVPAGASIVVESYIVPIPRTKFKKIIWNVTGITEPYFVATSLETSHLLIPEGVTVGYGVYVVTLNICNGRGTICNSDFISFYAVPGVSNCRVTINNYEAFNTTVAEIAACHVPSDRSPLSYQLFFTDHKKELVALTGPQFGNLISFVGPPSPLTYVEETNSTANATSNNSTSEPEIITCINETYPINLTIKVCDGLFICSFLEPVQVMVSSPSNVVQSTEKLLAEADNLASAGNLIGALSLLSVPARYGNLSVVGEQVLTYVRKAISDVPLMPGQVSLIYNCLEPFIKVQDSLTKKLVLAAIAGATRKAFSLKMTPPFAALNRAYSFTSRLAASNPYDVNMLMDVSKTQDALIETMVQSAPLAQRLEFRTPDDPENSVLFLYHMYLNNELFYLKKLPTSRLPEVTFRFSQKVREKISQRSSGHCGQADCHEVSIVFILYPGHSLHPEGDVGRRMSPVLSVKIFSPTTGKEIPFNEKDGLEMHFLQTANHTTKVPGLVTRCHKWDGKTWSMEDVQTSGISEGRVHCTASDSGLFTALEVKSGLSGGAIAGIIVASLMFVTIMGMVVIFFMRLKKEAKNQAKVSQQELARTDEDAFSIS